MQSKSMKLKYYNDRDFYSSIPIDRMLIKKIKVNDDYIFEKMAENVNVMLNVERNAWDV